VRPEAAVLSGGLLQQQSATPRMHSRGGAAAAAAAHAGEQALWLERCSLMRSHSLSSSNAGTCCTAHAVHDRVVFACRHSAAQELQVISNSVHGTFEQAICIIVACSQASHPTTSCRQQQI
jgi:hypothetical protein